MKPAAVLPHLSTRCQRWRHRRHSWVRRRDGGFDKRPKRLRPEPAIAAAIAAAQVPSAVGGVQ